KISCVNFHHLAHVLRCAAGEEIFVTNDREKFKVKIMSVLGKHIEARIIDREKIRSDQEITLIQCLPKKDKMDFVVGHCVELGLRNIIPVISERSIPRVNEDRAQKLLCRFQKIAKEQAQRAGIEILPKVSEIQKFSDAVCNLKGFDLILIPWEEEKSKKMKDILNNCTNNKKIAIIIGPEGGLTGEEVNAAKKIGAVPVSLGKTIFRTEIAGLVALSIIKYQFDWM
ncbi:MAG: RsmE family RNA methyltransferase, partial [bacterium]|nr:RsmE family RNA methyltransferase [bacterium]